MVQHPPPYELTGTETFDSGVPKYQAAENPGDRKSIQADEVLGAEVEEGARNSHSGPRARAKRFYRPSKKEIRRHAGKAVGVLLAIPCFVLGTSLHIAGGAIHMAGSIVGGIGDAVLRPVEGQPASRPRGL